MLLEMNLACGAFFLSGSLMGYLLTRLWFDPSWH